MPPEKRGRQTAVFSGRAHPRPATRRRQLSERLLSACLVRKMQTPSSPGGRRTQAKAILGIIWGQDHPTHRHAHVPLRKLGPLRGFPGAGLASEGLKAPLTLQRPAKSFGRGTTVTSKTTHPRLWFQLPPSFKEKPNSVSNLATDPRPPCPRPALEAGGPAPELAGASAATCLAGLQGRTPRTPASGRDLALAGFARSCLSLR